MTTDTEALTYDHIVALALEHGFKLKPQVDGRMALNDYVIDFARAVYDIGRADAKAEIAAPVVGRWYFVTIDGAATLCVDEADARESAAEADIAFPRMAPHLVTQLVPADQLADAVAKERERAARVCEGISDAYNRREGLKYPELKTDAETGADECADAIRARSTE